MPLGLNKIFNSHLHLSAPKVLHLQQHMISDTDSSASDTSYFGESDSERVQRLIEERLTRQAYKRAQALTATRVALATATEVATATKIQHWFTAAHYRLLKHRHYAWFNGPPYPSCPENTQCFYCYQAFCQCSDSLIDHQIKVCKYIYP